MNPCTFFTWLLLCLIGTSLCHAQALTEPRDNQKLLELRKEYAETGIIGPIVMTGIGAGLTLGSAVMAVDWLLYRSLPCRESTTPGVADDCSMRELAPYFGYTAIGLGAVGVPLLAIGIPWLFNRLADRRKLRKQINRLEQRPPPEFGLLIAPQRAEARITLHF